MGRFIYFIGIKASMIKNNYNKLLGVYFKAVGEALKDPIIHDLTAISPLCIERLERLILGSNKNDVYFSEWRDNDGWDLNYIYHTHDSNRGLLLKEAIRKGVCGGNPKLI